MTAIKKQAIELIMNLSDKEIREILEKYELTKPDSTAFIESSPPSDVINYSSDYRRDAEFLEALEE